MLRVGIFENEPIIQFLWEDIIGDMGFEPVGICATITDCKEFAKEGEFDVAILDINLEDGRNDSILHTLQARHLPVLVCSGLAKEDLPSKFKTHDILPKPFTIEQARRQLGNVAGLVVFAN